MSKTKTKTAAEARGLAVLRTTSLSLGTIETNIEAVLETVKEKSRQYQDITQYSGDEKQAKADRALLRKQKDMTKTTIASIQEIWNEPLEPFLSGGKEILKQFDYAIDAIDQWVKEGEAVFKEQKREAVEAYFSEKHFELVPLEHFFNERWLNKTVSLKEVREEIDQIIGEIYGNIKILENIGEYGMTAKALYLETLDMGRALRQVKTLKANAHKLAREQAEREARETQAHITGNAVEERREEREAATEERTRSLAEAALDIPAETAAAEKPVIMEVTLRFRGTKEQLLKLREYMTANGIAYEKIESRNRELEGAA